MRILSLFRRLSSIYKLRTHALKLLWYSWILENCGIRPRVLLKDFNLWEYSWNFNLKVSSELGRLSHKLPQPFTETIEGKKRDSKVLIFQNFWVAVSRPGGAPNRDIKPSNRLGWWEVTKTKRSGYWWLVKGSRLEPSCETMNKVQTLSVLDI